MKPSCAIYTVEGTEQVPSIILRIDSSGGVVHLTNGGNKAEDGRGFIIPIAQAKEVADAIRSGLLLVLNNALESVTTEPGPTKLIAELSAFEQDMRRGHSDPNVGYLIRHDHKDMFYTDTSEQTRVCEGTKSIAKVFQTKYAAQMATQGMKHATAVVEAPVYHVISIKDSPNSQPMYYTTGKTFEYGPFQKAAKLSAEEANRIAGTVPHRAFSIERHAQ